MPPAGFTIPTWPGDLPPAPSQLATTCQTLTWIRDVAARKRDQFNWLLECESRSRAWEDAYHTELLANPSAEPHGGGNPVPFRYTVVPHDGGWYMLAEPTLRPVTSVAQNGATATPRQDARSGLWSEGWLDSFDVWRSASDGWVAMFTAERDQAVSDYNAAVAALASAGCPS
jgi:hypothetical protein